MGIIVGMTFVVARRGDRYEIRESVHTEQGPRARTLANFSTLSEDVLVRARARATRPFDRRNVIARALEKGAPVQVAPLSSGVSSRRAGREFAAASQRFVRALSEDGGRPLTPVGDSLIELIGFAEAVARHQPRRALEPLCFPPLSRIDAARS